jgi:phosphoglycerate dehydrogenase-like enzyme
VADLVIHMNDARTLWSIPRWAVDAIRSATPDRFEVVVLDFPADGRGDGGAASPETVAAVESAEVYLGYGFPRELFDAARRGGHLRWVHTAAAGVAAALYPEMVSSSIILSNSAGIHAEPMAETVLAAILHFARGLDLAVRAQAQRRWDSAPFESRSTPVDEIAGKTLGIVGFGGIGQAVGRVGRAMGMNVIAYRRSVAKDGPAGVEMVSSEPGLTRLLAESDFVVLALPHTTATEGILNQERINGLRGGAVVINVGRGELIDEPALLHALRSGAIRGAALDVFHEEPLPPDSPFWALPNLLITPHVSATTHGFWRRETDLIVENIARYARGEELINTVDKKAGY